MVVVVVVGGAGKKKLGAVVVVVLPEVREVVELMGVVWVRMSGKPIVSGEVTTLGAEVSVVFLSLTAGVAPAMTVVVETVDCGGCGSTGSCSPDVVVT